MTREEERQEALTEAARTLDKVGEAIGKLRAGLNVDINPLVMQLFMAYANGRSLQAMALAGQDPMLVPRMLALPEELLEAAIDAGAVHVPEPPGSANSSGLILPQQG